MKIVYVALGGALGASLRYLTYILINRKISSSFPWDTLLVNLLGCLLIGIIAAIYSKNQSNENIQLFLTVGLLGGFTTFSSFALGSINLFASGMSRQAIFYILASNIFGLLLSYAGYNLTKIILK